MRKSRNNIFCKCCKSKTRDIQMVLYGSPDGGRVILARKHNKIQIIENWFFSSPTSDFGRVFLNKSLIKIINFCYFLLDFQVHQKTSKWTSLSIWAAFLNSPEHELSKEYNGYMVNCNIFYATCLGIWSKFEYFLNKSLIKIKVKSFDFVVFLVEFQVYRKTI